VHPHAMLSSRPMHRFFNCMFEPAPTIPFDPYRWRRDDRSVREKVVSGMRVGLGLVCGFLAVILAMGGLSTLPGGAPAHGRYGVLVSSSMLALASTVMVWTANRWAPFVPVFFGAPLLKILVHILSGPSPNSSVPYRTAGRMEAAELFAFCVVVLALTWRFVRRHPAATTFLDRLALTSFALATLKQVVTPYHWPPLPLLSATTAIFIAWLAYRWKLWKHHPARSACTPKD
jgi:hypothetical protein